MFIDDQDQGQQGAAQDPSTQRADGPVAEPPDPGTAETPQEMPTEPPPGFDHYEPEMDPIWDAYNQQHGDAPSGDGQEGETPPEPDTPPTPADAETGSPQGDNPAPPPDEGEDPHLPAGFDLKSPPDHWDEEDLYNFARYRQSQYDQERQRNDELAQKVESVEESMPLVRYIQDNPQLLAQVAEWIDSQDGQPAPRAEGQAASAPAPTPPGAQAQQQPSPGGLPERPTPPEKPANYDPDAALYNEESDSYQYREAKEQYLEDLADWNTQVTLAVADVVAEQNQQQHQKSQHQQMVQKVMFDYNMTHDEAEEFVDDFASNPDTLSDPEIWVEAFRAWKSKQGGADSTQADNPPPPRQDNSRTHEDRMRQKPNMAEAQRAQERRLPATAASQHNAQGADQPDPSDGFYNPVDANQDPVW